MLLVAPSVLMLMMSISSAQRATPAARAAPDWEDEFKCARFVCECPSARLTAVQLARALPSSPVHCRAQPGAGCAFRIFRNRPECVCVRARVAVR